MWAHLPEQLKKSNDDSQAEVKQLCEKIKAEIFDIELQRRSKFEYDLNEFQYERVMADTSRALFSVLKYLTNNEKQAVCLAQAVQQHVSKTWNQTPLGLALTLHYKNGSREMIDQLARCGFISSYHEVMKFCDSLTDHMIKNGKTIRELPVGMGPINVWFDHFDLFNHTPSQNRHTHGMVTEFTLHPTYIKAELQLPEYPLIK